VPDQVVVFQAAPELAQHAALAGGAAGVDVAQALRKDRHAVAVEGSARIAGGGLRCVFSRAGAGSAGAHTSRALH
jgi:hypothetical protein